MTTVFIGGSRKIIHLRSEVVRRVNTIVAKRFPILVGDANGVDRAVQQHLKKAAYELVEIFCTGSQCRNNVGGWPVRPITAEAREGTFGYFAAKDRAMAEEASVGLMIWDGKSIGTLMNMRRMLEQHKKVAVFVTPIGKFVDLHNTSGLDELVSRHAPESRPRLDREVAAESPLHNAQQQALFK